MLPAVPWLTPSFAESERVGQGSGPDEPPAEPPEPDAALAVTVAPPPVPAFWPAAPPEAVADEPPDAVPDPPPDAVAPEPADVAAQPLSSAAAQASAAPARTRRAVACTGVYEFKSSAFLRRTVPPGLFRNCDDDRVRTVGARGSSVVTFRPRAARTRRAGERFRPLGRPAGGPGTPAAARVKDTGVKDTPFGRGGEQEGRAGHPRCGTL
jgi:hypothetical protein